MNIGRGQGSTSGDRDQESSSSEWDSRPPGWTSEDEESYRSIQKSEADKEQFFNPRGKIPRKPDEYTWEASEFEKQTPRTTSSSNSDFTQAAESETTSFDRAGPSSAMKPLKKKYQVPASTYNPHLNNKARIEERQVKQAAAEEKLRLEREALEKKQQKEAEEKRKKEEKKERNARDRKAAPFGGLFGHTRHDDPDASEGASSGKGKQVAKR